MEHYQALQEEEPAFKGFNFSFEAASVNVFQAPCATRRKRQEKRSYAVSLKEEDEEEVVFSSKEVVQEVAPKAEQEAAAASTTCGLDPVAPSWMERLPTPVLQKILFLLEDPRKVGEELLDRSVMLAEEERKLSRSMMNFLLSCKAVYKAGMKRGGVASARPLFYAVSLARRGERARLNELLQTIGLRGQTQALLDRALMESCCTAAAELVCGAAALLLDAGASPRAAFFAGQPVHAAARRGHPALLRLLLDRGAHGSRRRGLLRHAVRRQLGQRGPGAHPPAVVGRHEP